MFTECKQAWICRTRTNYKVNKWTFSKTFFFKNHILLKQRNHSACSFLAQRMKVIQWHQKLSLCVKAKPLRSHLFTENFDLMCGKPVCVIVRHIDVCVSCLWVKSGFISYFLLFSLYSKKEKIKFCKCIILITACYRMLY